MAASAVVIVIGVGWQTLGPGSDGEAAPPTTSSTTTTTIPPVPPCTEGDMLVSQNPDTEWATILVDTERAIPAGFGPRDLHNLSGAGFPQTEGVAVRQIILEDLSALREAAEANGTPITILAGYRSYERQQDLFDRRVDELGASEAGSRVARPGHSEHQLGTTIDVTSAGLGDVDQSWVASPAGQWIASNASDFGFILSYPSNAVDRTCYDFEPWHLRYVGREMAAAVIDSGLTLREYLWQLSQGVSPNTTSSSVATSTTEP
jgi:D-alanyl-D-alanine carboxypeptidase